VAQVLHAVAHDPQRPTAVIASIHQPSSKLYQSFDTVTLMAYGRALYSGPGGMAPAEYFASRGKQCPPGYNVADFLLEVASEASVDLFKGSSESSDVIRIEDPKLNSQEHEMSNLEKGNSLSNKQGLRAQSAKPLGVFSEASFLTQLEVLSGREWKVLRRDKSLFISHVGIAAILGIFVGGCLKLQSCWLFSYVNLRWPVLPD
jgi:hypothetical protein